MKEKVYGTAFPYIITITVIVASLFLLWKAWKADFHPLTTGFSLTLIISLLTIYLQLLKTAYVIVNDDTLLIINKPFYQSRIPVRDIHYLGKTYRPFYAPAPSLKRLVIRYRDGGSVMISPADREGFVSELHRINPAIKVDL